MHTNYSPMARRTKSPVRGTKALYAIAAFKFVKGALLLAATIGAMDLLHKDLGAHVENWINLLRIDPDNKYIGALLNRLNLVHTHELKQLSFLTGFYAALFLTEGTGLAMRKPWAEYLTIVATALLIPLETYEIWKQPSVIKAILIAGNVAVVLFLIWLVRTKKRSR